MARIKIELPPCFNFSCEIPIRITDVNYGGHVGNDSILSLIHEARMQFLAHWGYTEMEFGSAGTIMANVAIEYKTEMFYGDSILVSVEPTEITRIGFSLIYKLEAVRKSGIENKTVLAAVAKTGMVCFDYDRKKIVAMPTEALKKWKVE